MLLTGKPLSGNKDPVDVYFKKYIRFINYIFIYNRDHLIHLF